METYKRSGRQVRPASKLKTFLDKAGFLGLALALLGGLAVTVPQAFAEAPSVEWAAVAEADGYTDTDHGAADYTADDYDADADSGYSYAGYGYIPAPDDNPGYGDDYSSDYGYAGTEYDADGGYDYDANAPPADDNDNEIPFVVVVSGGDAYQVATVQVETRSGRYEHIIALQPIHVAPAPAQIDVALSPGVVNQGSMANMFRINAPFSVAVPERAAVTAGEVSFYYLLTDLPDAPIAWWELVQLDPALRADSGRGMGGLYDRGGISGFRYPGADV